MKKYEVIVIGAGPVGLTAALALRSFGREVLVIESGAQDRIRPGSRAIFIHRSALEILNQIRKGLGDELSAHGLVFLTKRTLYRGREVYRTTYKAPPSNQLPAATNLPQIVTEKLLYKACLDAGVKFVWNMPILKAKALDTGVVLESETGERFESLYAIAADGSRSNVRDSLGLQLEGPRTSNAYVIVDVAEDSKNPLPLERVFHYEHPAVDGRNVLFVPFAGHWRIDLQCHSEDNPDDFSGAEGVKRWLPKVIRPDYADRITWVSTYIFRQAIANSFTDLKRRVLLVGEAAHIFAPFGARGLNSGIPDAMVAAKAIHQALNVSHEQEAKAFIDHFASSRRHAAMLNREASSIALKHLTAPSPITRTIRRAAGILAPKSKKIAKWMDKAPFGPGLRSPDQDGMQY